MNFTAMNEHTLLEALVPNKCCSAGQQGLRGGRVGTSRALTGMGGGVSSPCVSFMLLKEMK